MSGQINLELLIRVAAEQAKRELAAVTGETRGLTAATGVLGQGAAETGAKIVAITSAANSATPALHAMAAGAGGGAAEFTSYTATLGRAATAVAGTQNAVTGLTTNLAAQTAELIEATRETAAWQAVLDSTRAQFNPLFAASRQYEQALRDIAEAERMGALSALEAAAARDRAAQAMAPANAGLMQQARASGMATAANANLIAQWNDIGMMVAAGQSPMMLALQQGTQVTQVFDGLRRDGQGVLQSLGASFMGLLNPMNLATIAIIGFGAAGIQWLMKLGGETKTLEERMNALTAAFDRHKAISAVVAASSDDLARQFGEGALAAQGLYAVLSKLSSLAVAEQLKKTSTAAREMIGMNDPTKSGRSFTGFFGLGTGASQVARHSSKITDFDDALKGFENAKGTDAQIAAMQTLLERVQHLATLKGGISAEEQGLIDLLKQQADVLLGIQAIETEGKERSKREANSVVAGYQQQAELSRALILYGEQSAQVEAIRNRHAREALDLRLREAGIKAGSRDAERAQAAFDEAQAAAQAQAEAERRTSARAIVSDLAGQAAMAATIARYGEDSAQVEALRASQARATLKARLEELNAAPGLIALSLQLLDTERERTREIKAAEGARRAGDMLAELQNEAAISRALLVYGEDSLQVKQLQIAAERRAYAQQVDALPIAREHKDLMMREWEIARGLAAVDPYGRIAAGQQLLKAQSTRINELRLELSLAGQTEATRSRMLALYRAEQEIRDRNLDTASDAAQQLRTGALEEAALEARLDRVTDAWGRVDTAAASAIDNMVSGLTGGGKDALRGAAQDMLKLINELTLNNPLKNAILGTNLPTLADVGGLGGIAGRLFGGENTGLDLSVSAMNAASMAVTTPVVNLTAASVTGLPIGAAGAMGASALTSSGLPIPGLPGSGDVQSQIWSFFAAKGLKPHQIAGIMGNVSAESGFNPLAVGDNGKAFGLFQHNDRAPALFNAIGGPAGLSNVQGQLAFVWQELMSTELASMKRLLASSTTKEATEAFVGFERPQGYSVANPQGALHFDRRYAGAEAALAKFGDTAVSAQAQLGQLGTGVAQLGTGLQSFGASLGNTLQGIGASYGPGGAFVGGMLGEGLKWLTGIGFKSGGWTGAGATSDVAGVVHAEEYVFDAASTRKIGVANLEALRRGALKGYQDGGYVIGAQPPTLPAAFTRAREIVAAQQAEQRVVHEINVSGTGDAQIIEGVRQAISSSLEQYTRDFLPGEVRGIVSDKWRG
ncbi:phage tail tip lysozyme [Gemmobacter fulvus]|uniref:phage tail tip lysozyme n=1 Tax=Gemmobacter fulvus TaxID=2840474 RepID=UPI002796DC19|nr:phage tail tip lysozyme [Gemmobacter fulvus]MDQ1847667.1 phage tail tip lysozyme [Gemmobacter fulvus]